jgi:hypothetical protein
MKNLFGSLIFLQMLLTLPGCEFLGDVFKTGVWFGIIIVVGIIAVISFVVKLFSK